MSIDIRQLCGKTLKKKFLSWNASRQVRKNHALFVKAHGGALSKKSIVIHPRGHKMRKKAPRSGRKRSAPGVINPVETACRAARLVWPMVRTRIIQPPFNHSARGINSKGLALISFRAWGQSTISEVRMGREKSIDESENGIPEISWPFDAVTKATRQEFRLFQALPTNRSC